MQFKRVKDPKNGWKLKIIFTNGEPEYTELKALIEQNFPGIESKTNKLSQNLIDQLEGGYLTSDEKEESRPSTTINDINLESVFPLFCSLMDKKAQEAPVINRKEFIEVSKFNEIMLELEKANEFIRLAKVNTSEEEAKRLAVFSKQNEEKIEQLTKNHTKEKNDLLERIKSSEEKKRISFEKIFEEIGISKEEFTSKYNSCSSVEQKNSFFDEATEKTVTTISDFKKKEEQYQKEISDLNAQLKSSKEKNNELYKRIDVMKIQHSKYKQDLKTMKPYLDFIRKGVDFLERSFVDNEKESEVVKNG